MPYTHRVTYTDPDCRASKNREDKLYRCERGAQEQADIHNGLCHHRDGYDCAEVREMSAPVEDAGVTA